MSTVSSADGTTIAFTREGQGPPLILVDGAMCSRAFGPMAKLAAQLTPALALAAAKHIPVISRLAVYEPPFIVDDTRPPMPDGFLAS
jgi:hypothetical protein